MARNPRITVDPVGAWYAWVCLDALIHTDENTPSEVQAIADKLYAVARQPDHPEGEAPDVG